MLPIWNHIENEAFARARRCGRVLAVHEDYLQAEMNLALRMHYEVLKEISLTKRLDFKLGYGSPRKCRYCLRGRPDVKFKSKSHAIPHCLGNQFLISYDECDTCNKAFCSSFEVQLDYFTRPLRAFLGVKGKNGVPKFEAKGLRLWFDRWRRCLFVIADENSGYIHCDEENKRIIYRLPCQPFNPLDVYRALVKIGFSLLTTDQLKRYDYLREWLTSKESVPRQLQSVYGVGHFSYSFTPAKSPSVRVWERKQPCIPYPSLLVGITLPHLAFAFPMPPGPKDICREGAEIMLPKFDLSEQSGWTNTHWDELDMRDSALDPNGTFTVVTGYEDGPSAVSNEQFVAETSYSLESTPEASSPPAARRIP